MRTAAALLVLVLLLFLNPAVVAAAPPAARMDLAVLLWESAGAAECNDYADISPWADDSLYWACDAGVLNWSEGGRLDPGGTLTLAQLQAVLEDFLAR